MNLFPITERKAIAIAFGSLRSCLVADAMKFKRKVGRPEKQEDCDVFWHEVYGFWVGFGFEGYRRYWCSYGTLNPKVNDLLDISCEINLPTEGIDRSCAILLKDADSGLYLGINREFGGSRAGMEWDAHINADVGQTLGVEWPDDVVGTIAVLGKIGDEAMIGNLSNYIKAVDAFKALGTARTTNAATRRTTKQNEASGDDTFAAGA